MEQLLQFVIELVGLLFAQILKQWPVRAKLGSGHARLSYSVVEPVQLERKEQELRGDRGDLLLDVAEEFLPRRVRGVCGIEQTRIGNDAPQEVAQHLVLAHDIGERLAP